MNEQDRESSSGVNIDATTLESLNAGANKNRRTATPTVHNVSPVVPDELWPPGALPEHVAALDRKSNELVDAAWKAVGADGQWRCNECGATANRSIRNPQLCATCYAKHEEQTALMRRTNEGWMEQAEQLGLALYERQPEETDNEWLVWEKYRSYYPMAMPRWTQLAKEVGLSVAFVTKTAQRWNFKARMIQWAKAVDAGTQEKRIKAIREMNEKQLSMAQQLHNKVAAAISELDPTLLRPNEIVNLAKFGTELERRITEHHEEKVESTAVDTQSQAKQRTKAEDLAEVMAILKQTGVIDPSVVGVEQKTTILVKNGGTDE